MSALGRDGHPALAGFLPPVPLPRRMWAGGVFDFHGAIRIGETVRHRSVIRDADLKGTGPSRFAFRSLSPLFDTDKFMLHAASAPDGLRLWAARPQGPVAMEAQAHWVDARRNASDRTFRASE